jgi:hypothetical protein
MDKDNTETYNKIVHVNCRNPECPKPDDQFSIRYQVIRNLVNGSVKIEIKKGGDVYSPPEWREPDQPKNTRAVNHPCPWCGFINTFYLPVDRG